MALEIADRVPTESTIIRPEEIQLTKPESTSEMAVETSAMATKPTKGEDDKSEEPIAISGIGNLAKLWCNKYFLEGQQLDAELAMRHDSMGGVKGWKKYRRQIAMVAPAILVWTVWLSVMSKYKLYHLFSDSGVGVPGWYMTVMMFFGSMIAGMTSEGGASVAFPIMTLVFNIDPQIAVDFSLMIQSIGMTSATFSILFMRVQVEWTAIKFGTLGGALGVIIGLTYVEPLLTAPFQKMYFVSIWFAFAFSLFWLNRTLDRKVYWTIPNMTNWKRAVLFLNGVVGGIFTSIAGSGIDICSFATLTLLFRVTEKSATPTSVVLMGINTCIGFLWRVVGMGGVHPHAWVYWACAVPIVTLGAPLGSVLGSHFRRLVLASFVYLTDTAQLIGAIVTVRPWEKTSEPGKEDPLALCLSSLLLMALGLATFFAMTRAGLKLMSAVEDGDDKKEAGAVAVVIPVADFSSRQTTPPPICVKEVTPTPSSTSTRELIIVDSDQEMAIFQV